MSYESLGYAHYRFCHILANSVDKKSKQLAKRSKCVANLGGVAQNLEFINGHFMTISGHFFANHIDIFEVKHFKMITEPQFCERY